MPLNSTTYLESHGWEGKGVPLDGKQGRGLKKPLALPMKRNQRGLGKDRDRAVEWWDNLFEASAKTLNIKVAGGPENQTTNGVAAIPVIDSSSSSSPIATFGTGSTNVQSKVSLVSQAKRDYARKMLMSGFVRGREIKKSAEEEELERRIKEQESRRRLKMEASNVAVIPAHDVEVKNSESKAKEEKALKAQRKEEKRKRKAQKSARKEEKEVKKKMKEEKKRVKEAVRAGKEIKKEKTNEDEKKANRKVEEIADPSEPKAKKKKKRKREEEA